MKNVLVVLPCVLACETYCTCAHMAVLCCVFGGAAVLVPALGSVTELDLSNNQLAEVGGALSHFEVMLVKHARTIGSAASAASACSSTQRGQRVRVRVMTCHERRVRAVARTITRGGSAASGAASASTAAKRPLPSAASDAASASAAAEPPPLPSARRGGGVVGGRRLGGGCDGAASRRTALRAAVTARALRAGGCGRGGRRGSRLGLRAEAMRGGIAVANLCSGALHKFATRGTFSDNASTLLVLSLKSRLFSGTYAQILTSRALAFYL